MKLSIPESTVTLAWPGARQIAALLAVWLLAGCAFVGSYDETTDRLLTDLTIRTESTIASADAGDLSSQARQEFFHYALGVVRTLKTRSALYPKNEDETKNFADLEQRYLALEARGTSPRSSMATALRATLLDLQQIQVAKKRSAIFGGSTSS